MGYLLSQIFWCLLLAFLLGFLLGWFLRHLSCKKEKAELQALLAKGPAPVIHGDPVETIEGIGQGFGRRLRANGITYTDELLQASLDSAGRQKICSVCDIDDHTVSSWATMADLLRIDGVGGQWAELLWRSGVKNVQSLAGQDAAALLEQMKSVNVDEHRVHEMPGHDRVVKWIAEAGKLKAVLPD